MDSHSFIVYCKCVFALFSFCTAGAILIPSFFKCLSVVIIWGYESYPQIISIDYEFNVFF